MGAITAWKPAVTHGGAAYAAPRGLRITLILPVREPSVPRHVRELAASAT